MAISCLAGFAAFAGAQGASDSQARILLEMRKHYKQMEAPPQFIPLAPGAVQAQGWVRDWAETAAKGITGDLDKRHDVFRLGWTSQKYKAPGVQGNGLRWPLEQSAYWLDGLVRLAYILDDPKLEQQAGARLDQIVDGVNNGGESFIWWEPRSVLQVEDGDKRFDRFTRNFNNWAHGHMGRALVAYYRATGNPKILKALTKVYANYPLADLPRDEFRPHGSATNLDPMLLTYAMSGDRRILDNAREFAQRPSFQQLAHQWATQDLSPGHTVLYYEHARVPALVYAWTGNKEALQASRQVLELGLLHHGLPVGLASGEEHLMGTGSIRGLETCNVAAGSWTNKWMLQITGERRYADQMEQILLNAGPAAVSRDFGTVCYFQTQNRIDCVIPLQEIKGRSYKLTKLAEGPLCCVANINRMIPDYIEHMWMATLDGGLAATLYGPNHVQSIVADGTTVTAQCETDYPFRDEIRMTVSPQKPVTFPLYLRVPGWCTAPSIELNGSAVRAQPDSRGFARIERRWSPNDLVQIRFPMVAEIRRGQTSPVPRTKYFDEQNTRPITTVRKFGQPFATVHYGPLLFALAIPDQTPNQAQPDGKWQYALELPGDKTTTPAEVVRSTMPRSWQWQLDSPVKLRVPARQFDWKPTETQPLPDEPVHDGKPETITLVPYGCTKFRVSMFPVAAR